jgi:hypothetical protein
VVLENDKRLAALQFFALLSMRGDKFDSIVPGDSMDEWCTQL